MDAATITAVFTAAATAQSWTRTNLGLTTQVSAEDGYRYTVRLPKDSGKAFIAGRDGHAGDELLDIEATWGLTLPIVEAAMAATRI
ncbi:hypothetical protein AQJ11_02960 [Streptomyces corchorusii]|uniref:Uncharacterized protein n=2 Tax=Streptomyces TaxID=1883 RepID=A0A124HPK4_STRCK|nr:hypothetical protein [Streptomyces corchorusii]KUN32502.1 hypothetical protein AQJ11_02960 [Streptomyces corchorusii]